MAVYWTKIVDRLSYTSNSASVISSSKFPKLTIAQHVNRLLSSITFHLSFPQLSTTQPYRSLIHQSNPYRTRNTNSATNETTPFPPRPKHRHRHRPPPPHNPPPPTKQLPHPLHTAHPQRLGTSRLPETLQRYLPITHRHESTCLIARSPVHAHTHHRHAGHDALAGRPLRR